MIDTVNLLIDVAIVAIPAIAGALVARAATDDFDTALFKIIAKKDQYDAQIQRIIKLLENGVTKPA